MYVIKVKPISLNQAYRGRRFKTPELEAYKKFIHNKLPKIEIPRGKLFARYEFGVSSKNCDGDNLVKCFQDAIAEKYGFNDKQIYKWEFEKKDVPKGEEYVAFSLSEFSTV